MKRQILTLTGMLALISSAATTLTADYASTVSNLKPVAFWRLNESTQPPAADVAVNAGSLSDSAVGYYLGTAQHPVPGALTGRTDSAVGFDATANSVTMIPYMPEMNPKAPFTVEAWLSPNVEHAAGSGTLTCAISSGQFASPRTGWLIYQAENGWNLRMYDNKGAATSVNITGGTAPVSGLWYHVVAVYDGATAKLFVNGAKAAEAAQTSYVPGQSGGFAIGGRADGSFWWNGSADEVALYSKALTDDEISGHYANGSATNPSASYQSLVLAKSPLAYYRLNEAAYTAPTSLPVAANVGSAGASIAGSYNPGMKAAADGPKPPIYTGFEASNGGGGFNGSAGYVGTPFQMNDMSEFTIMGWIRRGAIKSGRGGYFGQNDLLEFGDADAGANIELWVNARGGNIKAAYPFKDNEWGHFAVIGDASSTVLYANGKEIGRLSGPLASYGTSSFNFNIGGGGIFNTAGDYFRGNIDEVAVFDKALTATAIQAIYFSATGVQIPPLPPALSRGFTPDRPNTSAVFRVHCILSLPHSAAFRRIPASHSITLSTDWPVSQRRSMRRAVLAPWTRATARRRAPSVKVMRLVSSNFSSSHSRTHEPRAFALSVMSKVIRVEPGCPLSNLLKTRKMSDSVMMPTSLSP